MKRKLFLLLCALLTMIGVQNAKAYQTPTADGVYYIQNVETGKFLSRGSSWGTRAITDDYGTPFTLIADENNFKIKHPDGSFLGDDTWMYTDCGGSTDRVRSYTIASVTGVEGAYTLKNTSNSMNVYVYLKDDGDKYCVAGNAIKGDNYTDDAQTYWRFLSSDERAAVLASNNNSDATAIATAAGISGVTSKNDLRIKLARFYNTTDQSSKLTNSSLRSAWTGWTANYTRQRDDKSSVYYTGDNCTELWRASGTLSQTAASLPAGIYKVTFNGLYRIANIATLYGLKENVSNMSNAYVKAGDYKGQIKGADVDLTRSGSAGSYSYNPDTRAQFISKLSSYAQDFYTYQATEGNMEVSVVSPAFQWDDVWTVINDVTITQYSPKTLATIDDGTYFLYSASDNKFLSRGNSYATRAIVDDYGLPVAFKTTDGITTVKYTDSEQYLFDANGVIYADNTTYPNWVLEATDEGFYIVNANDRGHIGEYLYVNTSDNNNLAFTSDKASATVWSVKSGTEQQSIVSSKILASKVAVAADAGETITTIDAFNTWINGLNKSDVTETVIGNSTLNNNSLGNWESHNTRKSSQSWNKAYDVTNNIVECFASANEMTLSLNDLPQGLYKATINGFFRDGTNENAWTRHHTDGMTVSHAYFKANNYQVALADWASEATNDPYYPDNTSDANTALNTNNKYLNEVYTYVDADGELTLQIVVPSWMDQRGWACYSNVKLYYFSEKPAPTSIALNKTEVTVDENDATSFNLTVTPTPAEASSEVVWTSSNTDVAIVDNSGEVTVISTGIATITAISALDANVSATCNLTVNYPEYTSYNKSFEKDGTTYYLSSTNLIKNGDFSYPNAVYGYTNGSGTAINIETIWTLNNNDGDKYITSGTESGSTDQSKRLVTYWPIENGKQYVFGFNLKGANNVQYISTQTWNANKNNSVEISGGAGETYNKDVWSSAAYLIDNREANRAYVAINARWLTSVSFDKFYLAEVVGTESASGDTKTVEGEVTEDYAVIPSATTPIVDISDATFDGDLSADFSSNANGFIIATAAQKTAMGNPKNIVVGNTCDNLVLTDGTAVTIPAALTHATEATYNRTIGASTNFGTICVPFALESNDDIQYYTVKSISGDVLTLVETSTVDAGVPAVYKKKGAYAEATNIVIESSDADVEDEAGTQGATVQLIGTFTGLTVGDKDDTAGTAANGNYYIGTDNRFYQGANYITVNPFRAYITGSGENAARLTIQIEDENGTTSIVALEEFENENNLKDGKYLIDGKIVIVKNGVKYSANGQILK